MMPNIDPRTMKNMMAKMGIKSSAVDAERVVIETGSVNIIISNPQVTKIEAQGTVSFQISGEISESAKTDAKVDITDEDVELVSQQTGITDKAQIREKLLEENGDIAKAIMDLTEGEEY
jgi:nascent polypeptide-associated complex subunit alpha